MKKLLVLCSVMILVSLLAVSVISYGQKAIAVRLAPDVSLNPILQQFHAQPELQAPEDGATNVCLSPTFEWTSIEWAEIYEFELAFAPTTAAGGYFADPLVSLIDANALVDAIWKCDIVLE